MVSKICQETIIRQIDKTDSIVVSVCHRNQKFINMLLN